MGRSILAVVTGYLVMAVAIIAMFALSFQSPDQVLTTTSMVFAMVYAFVVAILGGYVCGLIGRDRALWHAVWLVALTVGMGIMSFISAAGEEPLWFQASNLIVMAIGVLSGGYLRERRVRTAQVDQSVRF